jgi:phosphoglycerate dehydrogenase-like enzyme
VRRLIAALDFATRFNSVSNIFNGFEKKKATTSRRTPKMPRVLVVPPIIRDQPNRNREILEAGGFEVVYPTVHETYLDRPTLLANLRGIDAVVAGAERYDEEVFSHSQSQLRVVARFGVGYDAVDVEAASRRKIVVTITAGANEDSVAEQAVALIFGVFRQVPRRDRDVRGGEFRRSVGARIRGKTLGLVGLGRIGRALAWRAVGLGMNVIACDPCADAAYCDEHRINLCQLESLLGTADIVSLHLPGGVETKHIMNAKTLQMMKPSAVLINTARGMLVDEVALVEALKRGTIHAAGLDVFEREPLPADSPLVQLDNVVVSPHVAGWDYESIAAMAEISARCVVDLYQGRWPEGCVVNESIRAGWKW